MLRFFKLLATRIGASTSALRAQLRGYGSTGNDNEAESPDDCEVLQPVGFASRVYPSANSEAVAVQISDQVVVLFQVDKSVGRAQLASMDSGEARLYSPKEPTCTIRVRADGSIDVVSKTGQNVRLYSDAQTADKPVAKEGSGTTGHTHSYALTAGPYTVTGTITSATDTIAVGQGAQRVLVPST